MKQPRSWTVAALAIITAGLLVLTPQAGNATPESAQRATPPLTFGIYPGGYAGGGSTTGKPDDPAKISAALAHLQSGHSPFLLRDYVDRTTPFWTYGGLVAVLGRH